MSKDNRKIRPIDSNTTLDVTAELTKLTRDIRKGIHGNVGTCVVIMRTREVGANKTLPMYFGKGSFEEAVYMIDVAKSRWLK